MLASAWALWASERYPTVARVIRRPLLTIAARAAFHAATYTPGLGVVGLLGPRPGISSGVFPGKLSGGGGSPGS